MSMKLTGRGRWMDGWTEPHIESIIVALDGCSLILFIHCSNGCSSTFSGNWQDLLGAVKSMFWKKEQCNSFLISERYLIKKFF